MYQFKVLTQPTSDTTQPSLLLQTSNKRYIFGAVPEGTQRSLGQQKLKVSKLSTIFLTGDLNWDKIGGLPGLILTISDQGTKDLRLVNGSGVLNYIISSWRNFIFRFGMNLTSNILQTNETFEEEHMKVTTVNLKGSVDASSKTFNEADDKKLQSLIRHMFPAATSAVESDGVDAETAGDIRQRQDDTNAFYKYVHVKLPEFKKQKISTCYSIQFSQTRGKFQIEKAKQLNLPNPRLYGQLAAGKEVKLDDGRVIKPEDVLTDPRLFQSISIIDIPSNDYLQSAFEANWGENVGLVFHFLGDNVEPFSESYSKFIESFGPSCRHSISHPRYCPDSIIFESSALTNLKLKSLLIDQFNIPSSSEAKHSLPETLGDNIKLYLKGQTIDITSTTKGTPNDIQIQESTTGGVYDWGKVFDEEVAPLGLKTKYTKDQIIDKLSVSSTSIRKDQTLKSQVETITLGTGSALPSKYRNVVSSLVRIPYESDDGELSYRSVLLDAGENTIGTIKRTLGNENLERYFKELRMIYLSHLHADHHLGIVSIIGEWYKHNSDNENVLYLVTPWQYDHFISEWFNVEAGKHILDRIRYISCENFLVGKERKEIHQIDFNKFNIGTELHKCFPKKDPQRNFKVISELFRDVGIKKFATCRAIHCVWAYSCSITFKTTASNDTQDDTTFKVSYSGDTRPNRHSFSEGIGKHSDLLIHEATLENDMEEEAKLKRHCTINEAIDVSNNMAAKKLILTHFSQRYPKIPEISNNIVIDSEYCYAFDGMIVKYSQIGDQLLVFDQIKKAFETEEEGGLETGDEV